jgi:integrase
MLRALDWHRGVCCTTRQAVGRAFMLSLRTGMRAGEICNLTWGQVFDDYCTLPVTKTKPRNVPLPPKARAVIASMDGWDDDRVFGLTASTLDALFRRYRDRAGLSGFTFHDSRHTAATWLARRLDVLTLCKVFGWLK